MPPSQLKQLKASLRDSGLVGPQKSKKQKKASKDGNLRLQRNATLQNIRERFNPFEVKGPARKEKFEVTSNKICKSGPGRPGVTKGLGEEKRRATLLKEIQSRNKVGGLLDRRFGENDPSMTPEQRAAERFARQSQRKAKKSSLFNLEDEDEGGVELTHHGRSLSFGDENGADDFQEDIPGLSDDSDLEDAAEIDDRPRKRIRLSDEEIENGTDSETEGQLPERKKSKREVMEEVIAKSKLYKYERQQAKEDDDELRAELDKGMPELYDAIRGYKPASKVLPAVSNNDLQASMNPERAAILAGKDREAVEKEYNQRMNEMKLDQRAKPAERVKSQDEKATEEAERLKELERKRTRRMKGEAESSDEEDEAEPHADDKDYLDDAEAFGLAQTPVTLALPELDVEDEDEFVIDDDLISSDPDADVASVDDAYSDEESADDDGEDDFINGLVLPDTETNACNLVIEKTEKWKNGLAYTYPCPQKHDELLKITKGTKLEDLPTVVQRIRALHHAGLAEGNKAKLAKFTNVLTEQIAYVADEEQAPIVVLESLVRHLHSMAKSQPEAVGTAFRSHLRKIGEDRPFAFTRGDLIILTGISTIFPTSDHFHPVVTPAKLAMARYLGQSDVQNLRDLSTGVYCCTLLLQYERLSKRYIPEAIKYLTNALAILAPVPITSAIAKDAKWLVSLRLPEESLAITKASKEASQRLGFDNLFSTKLKSEALKANLLSTIVKLILQLAELWHSKSSFPEIIDSPLLAITHLVSPKSLSLLNPTQSSLLKSTFVSLSGLRAEALSKRKPLLLHNHRPLAIKSAIPKFEEGFNPDRHYDPDVDRAQLNKLKAEHKRERKGAMRELRKDANFVARESLREKKEKDVAYEKKFKRLVAEIQGEEGRESKNYEKEKLRRKGRW